MIDISMLWAWKFMNGKWEVLYHQRLGFSEGLHRGTEYVVTTERAAIESSQYEQSPVRFLPVPLPFFGPTGTGEILLSQLLPLYSLSS